MEEADWHDAGLRALLIILDGRSPDSGLREPGRHVSLALLLNAGEPQRFCVSDDALSFRRVLLQTDETPLEPDEEGAWTLPPRACACWRQAAALDCIAAPLRSAGRCPAYR